MHLQMKFKQRPIWVIGRDNAFDIKQSYVWFPELQNQAMGDRQHSVGRIYCRFLQRTVIKIALPQFTLTEVLPSFA